MEVKEPERLKSYFKLEKRNLLIIALTGIIYNIGMTAGPYFEGRLAQNLYEIIKGNKTYKSMIFLAALYLVVILFVQGSRTFKRFYVRRFANNTSKNMRHMLYNSIVHMKKSELENEQLGTFMTKAISDVDACVEGMRKFTTEVFDTGVVMVAYVVMLCIYDVRLAILSCIFIPVAYIAAGKCKGMVSKYNEIYKKNSGELNQSTMDMVENDITYRVFGLEKQRADLYEKELKKYEKSAVKANIWESAMQPIYYVIAMCGAVIIFWFGGKNVLGTGWTSWDIGVFTTFFSCFTKLALKSSKAAKLFNAVQKASVSWKRIKPMFSDYINDDEVSKSNRIEKITFNNVSVFYPGSKPLIKELSFELEKGQIIGITGGIACGKSAIGKIFTGEAEYSGNILIDKEELKSLNKEEKRKLIAYMGHEPELISSSIGENIALEEINSKSEVLININDSLETVCLEKEVAEMEDGINTIVGSDGTRLSGGQQARLALARCIYSDSAIQIFDDPFSAVDITTERQIFNNIRENADDKITFIVSHRLELFEKMDKVLFIKNGTYKVGTHLMLMKTEKEYEKLFIIQGGGRNNA